MPECDAGACHVLRERPQSRRLVRPATPEGGQEPHPLARELAAALGGAGRVLVVGPGDGRNLTALRAAGHSVDAVPPGADPPAGCEPYDAILSTHGLLHGTRAAVRLRLGRIAEALQPGGGLYATFGSTADARYGAGLPVEDGDGWAPADGVERGVAHAYFDEAALRAALATDYEAVSLERRDVAAIVGRWAHGDEPPPLVHWFVRARRSGNSSPRP